ncbi:MAG: ABC transporter permease [candidate division Zixibacteria bacterium]|nr:ABC transporter permease [candidate division Zixibacteria bacterium]
MITGLYQSFKRFVFDVDQLSRFSARMVLSLFGRPVYLAETMEQMYLIGIGSLFLVILTGIFAGQGLALQFSMELADFGSKNYLGRLMALSVIRELGPILAGLMVAARVAAGITAEIGSMKSSNQLDALTAFGVDPIRKLAAPRLIALVVMVPVLTVICDFIAIMGGWVIALFIAHLTSTTYMSAVNAKLTFGNVFIGLLKPFVFAFIIAFISCYKGFTATGGTKGVGRATTESVMIASITILIVNFIVTKVVFTFLKGYL